MAKRNKKEQAFKIHFTKTAKETPRRYQLPNKKWVGVGGPITITPPLPRKPYEIREATNEEYLIIFKNGNNKTLGYVEFIQVTESDSKVDS